MCALLPSAIVELNFNEPPFSPIFIKGDSWAHFVTNRIIFSHGDGCRYAELVKSARLKPGISQFAITTQGIRGVKAPPIRSEG